MRQLIPNSIFYIASTEVISDRFGELFNLVANPVNNAAGDLYALSQCNYIIGPPSTFNAWASFIGDVPLCTLHKKDMQLTLDGFKVCRDDVYKMP